MKRPWSVLLPLIVILVGLTVAFLEGRASRHESAESAAQKGR